MPELPEVETIRSRFAELLPGNAFTEMKVHRQKSFDGDFSVIQQQPIVSVNRRAKILDFEFQNQLHLITHLKMTGQLIYVSPQGRIGGGHPTADWIHDLPSNHTRIEYTLDNDTHLYFNDQRLFGWMRIITPDEWHQIDQRLGPDVIDPTLTAQDLYATFQRRTIPIKQAIMNNDIMSGVGNIYACDALNVAKINPFRSANSLSFEEVDRLLAACRSVILQGIELGGTTTDGKYVNVDGFAGGYQKVVRVYGRKGEACYNCGGTIEKATIGGRGTYYCPICQK